MLRTIWDEMIKILICFFVYMCKIISFQLFGIIYLTMIFIFVFVFHSSNNGVMQIQHQIVEQQQQLVKCSIKLSILHQYQLYYQIIYHLRHHLLQQQLLTDDEKLVTSIRNFQSILKSFFFYRIIIIVYQNMIIEILYKAMENILVE